MLRRYFVICLVLSSVFILSGNGFSLDNSGVNVSNDASINGNVDDSANVDQSEALSDVIVDESASYEQELNPAEQEAVTEDAPEEPVRQELTALSSVPNTEPISEVKGIFDLKGSLNIPDISNDGSFAASIPIAVPSGRNGVYPDLSLSYVSNQDNGIIGVGWNLSLASIQRRTKNGLNYRSLQFDLVEGGAVSELVSRSGWGSGFFGKKIESGFSKFQNTGTAGWIVTTREGKKLYFGQTANSRLETQKGVFSWLLDKIEDTNGNYLTVVYDNQPGLAIYPKEILYTGHKSESASNYNYIIKFNFEDRPDKVVSCISNTCLEMSKRLKSVKTYYIGQGENRLLRSFNLSYWDEDESKSVRSRLKSVQQCDNGDECLPATDIDWERPGEAVFDEGDVKNYPIVDDDVAGGLESHGKVFWGDLDGDGIQELIYYSYRSRHWDGGEECYDHKFEAYKILPDGEKSLFNSTVAPEVNFFNQAVHKKSGRCGIYFADINGDKFADLIWHTASTEGFYIQKGKGDGTFSEPTFHQRLNFMGSGEVQLFLFLEPADINGDGLTDLVAYTKYLYPPGDGEQVGYPPPFLFLGKTDCSVAPKKFIGNHVYDRAVNRTDLNSDGIADIFYYGTPNGTSSVCYVKIGKGDGSFGNPIWIRNVGLPLQQNTPYNVNFADLNYDGLPDLLIQVIQSKQITYFYGNGDGSFGKGTQPDGVIPLAGTQYQYEPLVKCEDINKDGLIDFVFRKTGSGGRAGFMFGTENGGKAELVNSIKNSSGGSVSVRYGVSSESEGYGNETPKPISPLASAYVTAPGPELNDSLPFVKPVVKEIIVDPLGAIAKSSYEYSGGYYDRQEREFWGFRKVTRTRPDLIKHDLTYYQDMFRKGKVQKSVAYSGDYPGDGNELFIKNYDWTNEKYSQNASWAHVRLLSDNTSNFYGMRGDSVSINTEYTYYPNNGLLKSESVTGSLIEKAPITTSYVYINADSANSGWMWRLARKTLSEPESDEALPIALSLTERAISSAKSLLAKMELEPPVPESGLKIIRQTRYSDFDAAGNSKTETRYLATGGSPVLRYEYDAYGNVVKVTDAKGYITTTEYDPSNTWPVKITRPYTARSKADHITQYPEYDYNSGKPIKEIDESGNLTTSVYDGFGRIKRTNKPDGGWVEYVYNDYQVPRSVVTKTGYDAQGSSIDKFSWYDGLDRPVQETVKGSTGFIITRTIYDNMGRESELLGPFNHSGAEFVARPASTVAKQSTDYDYHGNPLTITRNDGRHGDLVTSYEYSGTWTKVTDPDYSKKGMVKDGLGRIVNLIEFPEFNEEAQFQVDYTYNAANDLLSIIRYNPGCWSNCPRILNSYQYDTLGRLTVNSDPDLGVISYKYDKNDNMIMQTDEGGKQISFVYDELNRKVRKNYLNGSGNDGFIIWAYDDTTKPNGIGRLKSVNSYRYLSSVSSETEPETAAVESQRYHTIRYIYDSVGRISSEHRSFVDAGKTLSTYTKYDLAGRVSNLIYPGSDKYSVRYSYYPGTELISKTVATDCSAVFTDYTPNGKIGKITYSEGTVSSYAYDDLSFRLNSIKTTLSSGQVIQDLSYLYTPGGDIESINNAVLGTSYSYIYDARHQLIEEAASGNVTDNLGSFSIEYQYRADGKQPHTISKILKNDGNTWVPFEFEYDINGNMTKGFNFSTPNGNITERTIAFNPDNMPVRIVSGPSAPVEFVYDGNGSRAVKSSGIETVYYAGNYYEERAGKAFRYVFAGNQRIAKSSPGETPIYFHKDHLGSTTVNSKDGQLYAPASGYYPFGLERSPVGDSQINYTFTDQERDSETGLMNYDARLYDPALGVFVSADTVIPDYYNVISLNRYAYCLNNPLKYNDPKGHIYQLVAALGVYVTELAVSPDLAMDAASWGDDAESLYNGFKNRSMDEIKSSATNLGISSAAVLIPGATAFAMKKITQEAKALKQTAEVGEEIAENASKRTSRQARRDAMRKNNTPTSRSADSQTGSGNNRQYVTEGSDGKARVQTHHTADDNHPNNHWHDAEPKVDESGNSLRNRHGQVKYKNSGSSSADYN